MRIDRMNLRKNLGFVGLAFLVFYISGCGGAPEKEKLTSNKENQTRTVKNTDSGENNIPAKIQQSDNPPQNIKTVSLNEIENLKSSLNAVVKQIPEIMKGDDIGPTILKDAHAKCNSDNNKSSDTCKEFVTKTSELIGKVDEYCRANVQLCNDTVDSNKPSTIRYIKMFCTDRFGNSYPNCSKLINSLNNPPATNANPATQQPIVQTSPETPAATTSPAATPTSTGMFDSAGNLILLVIAAIAGLALLGGIGYFGYKTLNAINSIESVKIKQDAAITGIKTINETATSLSKKVKELEDTVKLQIRRIDQLETNNKALQRQISNISGQDFKEEVFTQPTFKKPEPKFPVLAEDYLAKNAMYGQPATADMIGGILINDTNRGNEFLIVDDPELNSGLFYAIPNQSRFNSKGEYSNYFRNYYNFDNPSSGAILIKKPALVQRVEKGWELVDMGILEVR